MQALKYSFQEAVASLWRNRGGATLAVVTIATALAVLGTLMLVTRNVGQMLAHWESSAEMSVFLEDDIAPDVQAAVELALVKSDLVSQVEYFGKRQALERFRRDFNELAPVAASLGENPFPASFEVRLQPAVRDSAGAEALAAQVAGLQGVAEVRYDRQWLGRLASALALLRGLGFLVVSVLVVGAALTIVSVVRLACHARRPEIEIMDLVGAPAVYVRGPFVMEGVLEGGAGALVALVGLWVGFVHLQAEYGPMAAQVLGGGDLTFLSGGVCALLVLGGMVVGCVGGLAGTGVSITREDR